MNKSSRGKRIFNVFEYYGRKLDKFMIGVFWKEREVVYAAGDEQSVFVDKPIELYTNIVYVPNGKDPKDPVKK